MYSIEAKTSFHLLSFNLPSSISPFGIEITISVLDILYVSVNIIYEIYYQSIVIEQFF